MPQSNFYGNDYDARYQSNNYQFEDYGYNVKNINRSSKKKITKFKRHKDNYKDS